MDIWIYLQEQIGAQGIWFTLFIYMFWKQDKDNKEREGKLEKQIDKSNEQIDKCVDALKDLKDVKDAVEEINQKLNK